ncbi:MAG: T9SS type A sorting domain-containing protein [Lunatimonas sp.]|uniref:T9SS type A sorting domain-containing protein n=1 Tax=Lunatimonas sp. TaxID=2060141 RepID=UPI00263B894F|nr:T9SS type A sorting domain-containing protein [Lunatimonas sp.]MCC5936803.1 T9SS type A sorting domain-containing protein [Lunatimonas sp.]
MVSKNWVLFGNSFLLALFCVCFQVHAFQQSDLFLLSSEVVASSVHQAAIPELATDGNLNTNWTSDNPLPDKYLSQSHQNILLGKTLASTASVNLTAATDGNLQTATAPIPLVDGVARVSLSFSAPVSVHTLGIRLGGLQQPVTFRLQLADGGVHDMIYPQSANYQHLRFSPDIPQIIGLELSSPAGFFIYELGMTQAPFREFLTFDLQEAHWVKEIHTKHWAGSGNAEKTSLYAGTHPDSLIWVADLNPESLILTKTVLEESVWARYLRLEHTLVPQNFRKVSVFELIAFGEEKEVQVPIQPVTWDPDAGIYAPLSKGAIARASSSVTNPAHQPEAVLDNNFATSWVSDNPLPDRYLANPDQNILLGKVGVASNGVSVVQATDGVLGNFTPVIQVSAGEPAFYRLDLDPIAIRRLSLRVGSGVSSPLAIRIGNANGEVLELEHPAWTNANRRYVVEMDSVTEILVTGEVAFAIQEIGAYSKPLTEHVTVDLGEVREVSWIRTRHWNGSDNSVAARLLAGPSLEDLAMVEELDPSRLDQQQIQLGDPVSARYIRIEHDLVDQDFKKATVQEITVYDQFGTYGPPPPPKPQQRSFGELFGLNTVWAWGTNKIPSLQGPDEGAQKFNRAASQARNYHNIHWDTTDPDVTPSYDPGNLNVHMQWTQWHREYQDWQSKGFEVDVTYTFDRFAESDWTTPYESAMALGQAFGAVYGPRNLDLVRSVEIGNEPWNYNDSTYVRILEGMAKGLKETDPDLLVLPAALQASGWEAGNTGVGKNYMGYKLSEAAAPYLDGVNLHLYSYARNEAGTRIAVHPEHPESSMQAVFAGMRFRDHNMPGKEVHVTEWGWDATSANEQAVNSEAVSEMSQAIYALRGLFWLSRMGVDRAHWYFYANVDVAPGRTPLNYDRSGLTESRLFNFREKRAFTAVESMQNLMGDLYFDGVIQEDEHAYIYALRNAQGARSHLIAWRPVAGEDSMAVHVPLPYFGTVSQAWYLSGLDAGGERVTIQEENGQWMLPLSSIPLLVSLGEDEVFGVSSVNALNLGVEVLSDEVELTLSAESPLEDGRLLQLFVGPGKSYRKVDWIQTDVSVWKARIREMAPGRYVFSVSAGAGLESNVVAASVRPWFSLHPNPASEKTVLKLSHPFAEVSTVTIIGPDGQVYREFAMPAFSQELELRLPRLKDGFYMVKLVNGTYNGQAKLLKR